MQFVFTNHTSFPQDLQARTNNRWSFQLARILQQSFIHSQLIRSGSRDLVERMQKNWKGTLQTIVHIITGAVIITYNSSLFR